MLKADAAESSLMAFSFPEKGKPNLPSHGCISGME
jgi:hypothetical protein